MIAPQPSCTDIYEAGLLPVEQALKQIFSALPKLSAEDYQLLAIEKAKGRTLAEAITASFKVPKRDNSAVDGYALNSNDLSASGETTLKITNTAYAGGKSVDFSGSGTCIRIMTGASIPNGVDSVIMQEHVQLKNNSITIADRQRAGQNIRLAGEDIQQGETILSPGKFISPADIGLLASLGISEIKVKRKLKIAIASTGNEVISIGDIASTESIYDSNRYCLLASLDRPDIEIFNLGILDDSPEILLASFEQASLYADIIISSGGVSVGDADHTKTALSQSGQVSFWKIAIKPGRPLAFGHIGKSVFFGLPGNPVAVMVTFYQFVLPALESMLGITNKPISPTLRVKSSEKIRKKPGRTEIVRAILQQDSGGEWTVKSTGKQGSGILRSMSLANAFIILQHDQKTVQVGETVTVQPFSGLF